MPEAGTTKIVVEGEDFETAFAHEHLYILADEPHTMSASVEIRDRPGRDLFYRGVRVMQFQKSALYTYNCLTKLELTEDRTVKHSTHAKEKSMALKIVRSSDPIRVERLNLVIYGPPGVGKSSLAFTADTPLLLDFDQGAHRAANRKDIVRVAQWGTWPT
jgi:hypothetical protein